MEVVQKSLLFEQTANSRALFFSGKLDSRLSRCGKLSGRFFTARILPPPNYTRYKNSAFDRLYEQALVTADDSTRYSLYRQMDKLIIDDAPVVPLWYDEVIRLVNTNVSGFPANGLNMLELRKVRVQ